ncbi:uncharacterized protein LOC127749908 [Frankliniella occidentalis]|uniref:Uncharacterized protein LOC127749908 n=1 Tax=Frankliniella occidentalis TaxID=133901 RepID=A0A9C6WXS7_FRAOC|nr:uncharacterized protein LOC127749908 [Frankliniella occidentalis]
MAVSKQNAVFQLSDPPESSAAMEGFPDELLLLVMRFVPAKDLLACRLVCKKFTRLVADPVVWRHRSVDLSRGGALPCAVLRLAPCLNVMSMTVPLGMRCPHAFYTECAAAKLVLRSLGSGDAIGQTVVSVIRNQERLGRLRSLSVELPREMRSADAAVKVLTTLATTSGLEELSISGSAGSMPTEDKLRHLRAGPTPTLRRFHLDWRASMWHHHPTGDGGDRLDRQVEDVCRFVLAQHATTLEEISFNPSSPLSTTLQASLLANLPSLHELSCPVLPGLPVLAACRSLRKLTLMVTRKSVGPETAELLRRAEQLRDVTLVYYTSELLPWTPSTAGVDLVWHLAASGRSDVESLRIANIPSHLPQLRPLLRALPLLTRLRHLCVEAAPDELLRAITPVTTPALQSLAVNQSRWGCIHAWLHRREVKTLLGENPSLHVKMCIGRSTCIGRPCDVCAYECHPELWDTDAGFFTHDPRGVCPCPEIHDRYGPWYYIPDIASLEMLTESTPRGWADVESLEPVQIIESSEDSFSDPDLDVDWF